MKLIKLLLPILVILCACNEKNEFDDINNKVNVPTVLQERDPNYPLILSKTKEKSRSGMATGTTLSHDEYLGRSFHLDNYPYDDEINLGYAVVDFSKASEKGYITSHGINRSVTNYFAFSDYDHYLEKSKITNTVTSGFKINLGFFSFGHKNTMTEVFESATLTNKTQVGGEANIYIQSKVHELQYSSNIRKDIILYYLNDIFKDEVYNTPTSEFYKNYGGFVLKKFITGGRATALYYGQVKESYLFESTETIMNESIDAGIKYKDKGKKDSIDFSADLEFGWSNNDGNSTEYSEKFTSLNYSIQTVGGIPVYPAFPAPKDLFETKIDLSSWLSSLSDPANHALIRIYEEGLVPISDFILERNLSDRINKCIQGFNPGNLCEPEICILYPEVYWGRNILLPVYLHTRNNEYIFLENGQFSDNDISRNAEIFRLSTKYSKIFKTRIVTISEESVSSSFDTDYDGAKIEDCKVFQANDGTIYLLDIENKQGYSIHDDYLLDTYAIRDYVNSLPKINVNMESLFDYDILAL